MTTKRDIIIVGGGRVGFQTATILDDQGHDVRIVERDEKRCDDIVDSYVATVIEGDATDPDVLEQADVDGADVVAALTGETGVNLAVCMAAQELASVRTVCRIDRAAGRKYTRFVDAVLFPEHAGARAAANQIVGGGVRSLEAMTGELDIVVVRVEAGAPAAEKELRSVRFPSGTLVISDESGDRIARPETTLTPGERYVVAVEPDVADEVMNLLRG